MQILFFVNINKVTYKFHNLQQCRLGSFQFVLNRYIQIPQNDRYFSFQIIYVQQLTSTWGNVQTQPGQHSCFHSYRICELVVPNSQSAQSLEVLPFRARDRSNFISDSSKNKHHTVKERRRLNCNFAS